MELELSIILVNYNGKHYLDSCLKSIEKNVDGIDCEVILIDNNSSDDSCTFLKNNYPNVNLIESKLNNGFGKGNNLAVAQAKGKYLLLLNLDTVLLDNIKEALDCLKNDLNIGALGINMLNQEKQYLHAAGSFPKISNLFWMKKSFEFNKDFVLGTFSKKLYEVDWITGSFILMPKSVFNQIRGFDEDYFLYVEDVDFCKRIVNLGYKIVFFPGLQYIHYVGFNKKKNPMLIKGYRLYINKHFKGFYKYLCLIALKVNESVKKIKELF
ncbi:glycosyltransferase family 2 protein [Flavobacterium sp. HXWNR69]|uniref:Glycosyltransferase family 2 protein n=1 Tax=Flavobacterium fragile TaxID=2949085 RepID=A0ABT0TET3_9FLAO|nr:glycosyltransferase family 2 protein [Flavobacterium sp. HXWNR69]MCL9769477.1 glycosyltransferase family 2 protein [Flavobacterium sp. HXWNR69]